MQQESPVHQNILDNMSDGVLSVDLEGCILTFNPAAAQLLQLDRDEVLGRPLAEALFPQEGLDAFNQAILDAVYGTEVGHRSEVEAQINGARRFFALTTSYLRAAADSGDGNFGVVAVFVDLTEVEALRASEKRFSQALEAQHNTLQGAYRDLEESNQALASALRQAQKARLAATAFVIVLFLAVGLNAWRSDDSAAPIPLRPPMPAADGPALVVAPQRLRATIVLPGHVAPQREVHVASPITGKVAEAHFQYGQPVAQGQRLLELDTSEVEGRRREAQAAYIRAQQQFQELEDWDNNLEVDRARQALSKAALALEIQKNELEQTAFLLEQGVVSASQHEAAERQYHSQQLDYESLKRSLEVILAKGGEDAKRVAQLELDNARIRLQWLEETLRQATIKAPIAGVVLQQGQRPGVSRNPRSFAKGEPVTQGESLLTIGDVDGLSVVGWADEVDIAKIRLGQQVSIRGDAFPDLELQGTITYVSQQARLDMGQNSLPSFAVAAAMENLRPAQLGELRLGMSASLEVVVRDRADALLVPINAVQVLDNGETWLRIKRKNTDAARRIQVETGLTTLDSVEIVSGLQAGDAVVLPGAEARGNARQRR